MLPNEYEYKKKTRKKIIKKKNIIKFILLYRLLRNGWNDERKFTRIFKRKWETI